MILALTLVSSSKKKSNIENQYVVGLIINLYTINYNGFFQGSDMK